MTTSTTRTTAEERQAFARTVIEYLGGNRITVMIGVKQIAVNEKPNGDMSVVIKFKAKASNKANAVEFVLTSQDLFDVEFLSIRGMNCNSKGKAEGLYADMLRKHFEDETGLYLSL